MSFESCGAQNIGHHLYRFLNEEIFEFHCSIFDNGGKIAFTRNDISINESVARTLEYSYNDYCIWKLAEKLNKPESEVNLFKERSYNYINVFDPTTNFMRGKSLKGEFESPFIPDKWGGVFTEGSAWLYTW